MAYILLPDYLLLIPYLAIFYVLAKLMCKNHPEAELRTSLMNAFWLRMIGSILYSMVIQYYYGYGDSFTYFRGSNFFTNRFSENLSDIKYLFSPIKEIADWYLSKPEGDEYFGGWFNNPSGNMVMKISALLSYLSFNRFIIISLFFGFFSFLGQWKLFLVFDDINKGKNRKLLAIATLYTPSIWFWGSGLLKDSICLGAMGFMIHILYSLLVKKKFSTSNMLYFLLLFYVVAVIKSYITYILIMSLTATFIFIFLRGVKSFLAKLALLSFALLAGIIMLSQIDFTAQINDAVQDAALQINTFQQSYQSSSEQESDSKGGFSMKEVDPSLSSILIRTPWVVFSCLYRPFIWESRKVMIFFTSIESMILLYCTLYLIIKNKFTGFFKIIFNDEYLFFCFILSLFFATIIGFTTFNFGTMIRYKIIFLPFFYFMLVRINTIYRQKN